VILVGNGAFALVDSHDSNICFLKKWTHVVLLMTNLMTDPIDIFAIHLKMNKNDMNSLGRRTPPEVQILT
jgi:hypothetical protein